MKTLFLCLVAVLAVVLLVSATVWEGVTDVVSGGDLPGGSFGIATNSFPKNTIVDITNLENGKMVRVKVVSGLDTTGLLATLSRNAADSINLRGNSTCRIRITQPSDDIAFSHFRLGPIVSSTIAESTPEISIASGKLTLLPAEERPPVETTRFVIESDDAADNTPPASVIAPETTSVTVSVVTPAIESPIKVETEIANAVYFPPSDFSPFPVPLISSLEPEKWYVQVGVYTHPNYVEDEISRIGTAYPLVIQNVGTDTSPMFRVLLGPLNQGESGAMLQRFKSIGYNDAFVRHN